MSQPTDRQLSRRERQIMDVLYERGRATAAEVREALPDAPGYSAVRTLLRILEEKGHVRHEQDGARYIYLPREPVTRVAESALARVVRTFFGGSVEQTVATLISSEEARLSDEELERLSQLIREARERGS
jgi:predicted transcriptional regulator